MKKTILLITLCVSMFLMSCGSTPQNIYITNETRAPEVEPTPVAKPAPDWYINKDEVYPTDTYVSAIGNGYTRSEAAADAEIALANYFGHNVKSTVTGTSNSSMDSAGNVTGNKTLNKEYVITLDKELFAVEKSKPWYDVDSESYYICAYLDREKAFDVYLPILLDAQKDFNNFYDESVSEDDFFKKIGLLKEAKIMGAKYRDVLKFAQLIMPNVIQNKYIKDFDKIANVDILLTKTQNDAAVKVVAEKDYGNKLKDVVTKIVGDNGFVVSDTSYQYIVDVKLDENLIEDEYSGLLSATPAITVSLQEKNSGDIPFSYTESFDRVKSYSKELLEKKAADEIEAGLRDSFSKEFNSFILSR